MSGKCIVIVGMHRSGSSLVAKIFYEWGVNLGADLMEQDYANTNGYYENWDFVKMNNHLLSEAGGSWNYPVMITEPNDAAQNLVTKHNGHELWGWKDNRTCFTFKAYEPALKNVMFVVCKRKREAVIQSLFRTHSKLFQKADRTEKYFGELYDLHYKAIEIITEQYPTISIDYDDLYGSAFFKKEMKHF